MGKRKIAVVFALLLFACSAYSFDMKVGDVVNYIAPKNENVIITFVKASGTVQDYEIDLDVKMKSKTYNGDLDCYEGIYSDAFFDNTNKVAICRYQLGLRNLSTEYPEAFRLELYNYDGQKIKIGVSTELDNALIPYSFTAFSQKQSDLLAKEFLEVNGLLNSPYTPTNPDALVFYAYSKEGKNALNKKAGGATDEYVIYTDETDEIRAYYRIYTTSAPVVFSYNNVERENLGKGSIQLASFPDSFCHPTEDSSLCNEGIISLEPSSATRIGLSTILYRVEFSKDDKSKSLESFFSDLEKYSLWGEPINFGFEINLTSNLPEGNFGTIYFYRNESHQKEMAAAESPNAAVGTPVAPAVPAAVLAVPQNITLQPGIMQNADGKTVGSIILQWGAVEGATKYFVQRQIPNLLVYPADNEGKATHLVNGNLELGKEYCYRVKAANDNQEESNYSEPFCATTPTIKSAAENVTRDAEEASKAAVSPPAELVGQTATEKCSILGDLDGSGEVNALDLQLATNLTLNIPSTSAICASAFDPWNQCKVALVSSAILLGTPITQEAITACDSTPPAAVPAAPAATECTPIITSIKLGDAVAITNDKGITEEEWGKLGDEKRTFYFSGTEKIEVGYKVTGNECKVVSMAAIYLFKGELFTPVEHRITFRIVKNENDGVLITSPENSDGVIEVYINKNDLPVEYSADAKKFFNANFNKEVKLQIGLRLGSKREGYARLFLGDFTIKVMQKTAAQPAAAAEKYVAIYIKPENLPSGATLRQVMEGLKFYSDNQGRNEITVNNKQMAKGKDEGFKDKDLIYVSAKELHIETGKPATIYVKAGVSVGGKNLTAKWTMKSEKVGAEDLYGLP